MAQAKLKTISPQYNSELKLERLIFKTLSRALKERRLYSIMPTAFGHWCVGLKAPSIYWTLSSFQNNDSKHISQAFDGCFTIDHCIYRQCKEDGPHISNMDDIKEVQEFLMFKLNSLIHVTIEPYMQSMRQLEDIGRESWNKICTSVFGEGYHDYTGEAPKIPNQFLQALYERGGDRIDTSKLSALSAFLDSCNTAEIKLADDGPRIWHPIDDSDTPIWYDLDDEDFIL